MNYIRANINVNEIENFVEEFRYRPISGETSCILLRSIERIRKDYQNLHNGVNKLWQLRKYHQDLQVHYDRIVEYVKASGYDVQIPRLYNNRVDIIYSNDNDKSPIEHLENISLIQLSINPGEGSQLTELFVSPENELLVLESLFKRIEINIHTLEVNEIER